MNVLLKDKNCVFTEMGLRTQEYSALIAYENIIRLIHEKRYLYYEVMFYDQRNKKRKIDISYEEKNKIITFVIFNQKVPNLHQRQGHMPFFKAGAIWLILYIVFVGAILTKFFIGSNYSMTNIEVPWIIYPLFLLVNLIPIKNLLLTEMIYLILIVGFITIFLMFISYIRSDVMIYEKQKI